MSPLWYPNSWEASFAVGDSVTSQDDVSDYGYGRHRLEYDRHRLEYDRGAGNAGR
jgi:hypothetical protein